MYDFSLIGSICLFIAAILFGLSFKSRKALNVLYFIGAGCWLILIATYLVADSFTGNGIDEATLYHLKYGLGGAGFGEYKDIIIWGGLALIFLIILITYTFFIVSPKRSSRYASMATAALVTAAILSNPSLSDIYRLSGLSNPAKDSDFTNYYIQPTLNTTQKQAKNIVYIYAESLEQNYFDESLFPGLTPGLNNLQKKASVFTNIKQVYGTGWTIAGITASQCGIPLVTPSHGNSMSGMQEFLPGAVCLGDLLADNGYRLDFLGGAKLEFAGKGKFFKSHGFKAVDGLSEFKARGEAGNKLSAWGLYDDQLLELVKKRYKQLAGKKQPFGIFTLTLDTHHPKGHISKSCSGLRYQDGLNPMLNSVHCSDKLLSNFIQSILDSDTANNTIVVLASDHLAMKNLAWDTLEKKPRNNLLMIFDSGKDGAKIEKLGSALDIAPTLIEYMNLKGSIGLGQSLLSEFQHKEGHIFQKLPKWRDDLLEFWSFPQLIGNTTIDLEQRQISFAKHHMKLPVLLEVKPNLRTIARFQFHRSAGHKSFQDHIGELDSESHFLWVDQCNNFSIPPKNADNEFCIGGGDKTGLNNVEELQLKETFTIKKLRKLMGMQL
ncbi:sulfatase-like hydrolase/transferase [uncultured Pseudoteredinibacter sp.]|uniref:sulfatase-like hydrolase/transferase n=1 Tax=uncultured Pseudoteredinibacter sp. TaxID=1641701 RepID=UPI002627E8FF|nr:sulfatase-like hydrolase/transferase [uncultured Pseudoteredinibacter sp.]